MKKLVITVVVIVGVLLVVDRVGVYAASQVLASQIQKQQDLQQQPSVNVRGFPFLTQVVGGKYQEVDVAAKGVVVQGLTITEIDVVAKGIKVALGDAISGKVKDVPVDSGTATVRLDYADLNAFIAKRADNIPTVSYAGTDKVKVTARLSAFGQTITPSVDATVTLENDVVRIVPLSNALAVLPSVFRSLAGSVFTLSFPLTGIPFGIRLTSGEITQSGVVVHAETTGAVFPVSS